VVERPRSLSCGQAPIWSRSSRRPEGGQGGEVGALSAPELGRRQAADLGGVQSGEAGGGQGTKLVPVSFADLGGAQIGERVPVMPASCVVVTPASWAVLSAPMAVASRVEKLVAFSAPIWVARKRRPGYRRTRRHRWWSDAQLSDGRP